MKTDVEILDKIEEVTDAFVSAFFNTDNDDVKRALSVYAMGAVTSWILERKKQNNG